MMLPEAVLRTTNICPNFMWDNAGYVLGADKKGNPARSTKLFDSFKRVHHYIGDSISDSGMKAVLKFLDTWDPAKAELLEYWDEMENQSNLVFQLNGEFRYIHDHPDIKKAWLAYCKQRPPWKNSICLISGQVQPIARLHPKIKGVKGSKSTGASIVSFEQMSFRFFSKSGA